MLHWETRICEKLKINEKSMKNQWSFIDFSVIFDLSLIFHRFLSRSVSKKIVSEKIPFFLFSLKVSLDALNMIQKSSYFRFWE